jgi:hypothetical protein
MVGNVWELVQEAADPSDATRKRFAAPASDSWYQMRGESYGEPLQAGAIWDYGAVPAGWKDKNIGFRCVKDKP